MLQTLSNHVQMFAISFAFIHLPLSLHAPKIPHSTLQRLSVWFYEGIFKSRLKIKPAASLGLVPPCCGGTEVTEFGRSQPIGSPQLSIFLCIYLSFLLFCWQVLNLFIYEGWGRFYGNWQLSAMLIICISCFSQRRHGFRAAVFLLN